VTMIYFIKTVIIIMLYSIYCAYDRANETHFLTNDMRTKTGNSVHYRYMLLTIPKGTVLLCSRHIECQCQAVYEIFRRVSVVNVSDQKYPIFEDRSIAFRVGVETTSHLSVAISVYKISLLIYINKTSYNVIICLDDCMYIRERVTNTHVIQ